MTELFKKLDFTSKASGEKSDCTVKAWAVVTGLTYTEAHCDLAAVGRKRGRGIPFRTVLGRLLEMRDKKYTDVTADFKGAKTAITASRLLPKRGAFLIFFSRHVAAFRNGTLEDWTVGRRHRVLAIYRINSLPKDAAPVTRTAKFDSTLQLWITPGGGIVNWRNLPT